MDITPLYELRTRLRSAAIAGTGLMGEDFRLARAVEVMTPLEKASPVLAKIGQLSRQLVDPATGSEARSGLLLEALSLVDAVLCTQASVGTKAEIEPLPPALCQGEVVVNAPYSVVKRLQDALTTSGGGNFGFIMDTRQNSPELLRDYRVKGSMVKALGAGYSELAEQVTEWLKQDGYDMIPLLMDGFDPKGKKEMVRRIWVLEALSAKSTAAASTARPDGAAGTVVSAADPAASTADPVVSTADPAVSTADPAVSTADPAAATADPAAATAEPAASTADPVVSAADPAASVCLQVNGFLMEQLAEAEKDVRLAIIYALHNCPENAGLLMELARTERGKAKKAAHYALASIRCSAANLDTVTQFWKDYLAKKPNEALEYLALSNSAMAADLILQWQKETGGQLKQELLEQALYINEDKRICEEALRRYETAENEPEKVASLAAACRAKILLDQDCSDWMQKQISKKTLLASRLDGDRIEAFLEGIGHLVWDRSLNAYALVSWVEGAFDCLPRTVRRPVALKVDENFMNLLNACGNKRVRGILWNLDKNRAW